MDEFRRLIRNGQRCLERGDFETSPVILIQIFVAGHMTSKESGLFFNVDPSPAFLS